MPEKCVVCEKLVLKHTSPISSLHRFPSCPKKRQVWLKQCGLANAEVLPNRRICSFHFEPSCLKSGLKRRVLNQDAVPTIFKNGHVNTTNLPLKNVKVITEKSSKMPEKCIVCEKLVLKYPSSIRSLHKFPACPKRQKMWLKRCGLVNEDVLPNHKICSFHFEPSCFKYGLKRRVLHRDAEPTIFKKGHARVTNYTPLDNEKGKPKNWNKNRIAVQYRQLRGIAPTKAVNKEISGQNHESRNIPFTRYAKKVLAGKNRQSRNISKKEAIKEIIYTHKHDSCYIPLTKALNVKISVQNRDSSNISLTGAAKKGIASQNRQFRDISPTKVDKKRIPGQNRGSCAIPLTNDAKKVFGKNNQSHDISPAKTVKKGVSSQNRQSRDISPNKAVQKKISSKNHVPYDFYLTSDFIQEVFQRSLSIVTNKKREMEQLDVVIAELENKIASTESQLKIARNRIALLSARRFAPVN